MQIWPRLTSKQCINHLPCIETHIHAQTGLNGHGYSQENYLSKLDLKSNVPDFLYSEVFHMRNAWHPKEVKQVVLKIPNLTWEITWLTHESLMAFTDNKLTVLFWEWAGHSFNKTKQKICLDFFLVIILFCFSDKYHWKNYRFHKSAARVS